MVLEQGIRRGEFNTYTTEFSYCHFMGKCLVAQHPLKFVQSFKLFCEVGLKGRGLAFKFHLLEGDVAIADGKRITLQKGFLRFYGFCGSDIQ